MQTFDIEHNRLFNELTATLKEDIVKIAGKCNGGKSILFVYPPRDEDAYVAKAREDLTDGYSFIDVRESFRLFLDEAGKWSYIVSLCRSCPKTNGTCLEGKS